MNESGAAPETRDGYTDQPDQLEQPERQPWPGKPSAPAWEPAALSTPPEDLPPTLPRLATPPPSVLARMNDLVTESELSVTGKRERVTDLNGSPALRLNQRPSEPPVAREGPARASSVARAPAFLGLTRLVVGLALLAAAYGVALLETWLGQALWLTTPSEPVLTTQLALYALEALGLLWLAIIGLGLVIVGFFSLFLALTRRGW